MLNDYSRSSGPTALANITLGCVWNVDGDSTYQTPCTENWHFGMRWQAGDTKTAPFFAMRTLAGAGRLFLKSGRAVNLTAGTLYALDSSQAIHYHTVGDRWRYWLFVFTSAGAPPFPMGEVMDIPLLEREETDFEEIFTALRRKKSSERKVACASFLAMAYRWMADWEGALEPSPHYQAIQRLVDEMHRRLCDNWSVREMASAAHMSNSNFRQVFSAIIGEPPKQFYDRLRLTLAREMLELGLYNVNQVSEHLGFSCPFYFSRAFHRHFGLRPSHVRQTGKA